jgi:hypothetical protein
VRSATSKGSDWARKSEEEERDGQSADDLQQADCEASETKEKEDPAICERGVRGEEGVEGKEAKVGVEGAVVTKGAAGADGIIGTTEAGIGKGTEVDEEEEGATEAEVDGGTEVDEEEEGIKIVSSYFARTIWRSLVRRRYDLEVVEYPRKTAGLARSASLNDGASRR